VVSGGGGTRGASRGCSYAILPGLQTEWGSASDSDAGSDSILYAGEGLFDGNFPNDDWAEHDLVGGNGNPVDKPFQTTPGQARYGAYNT